LNTFIGVDLGWYGKPSGLASIRLDGLHLRLRKIDRLETIDEILAWIQSEAGQGSAVIGIDAPLVIPNEAGIRPAERELNRDFRRFHAGCHAANLGRPFASKVISFSQRLEQLGFGHGASVGPRQEGRYQIEVHPHAATINLFGLTRIMKYKRGAREQRGRELGRLAALMRSRLPQLHPALSPNLPAIPAAGNLKPVEDQIDAVLCAYIAAHWWFWATDRNAVYGTAEDGYIIVPGRALHG
jgi:predicted RNase H-like nuclease